MPLIPRPKYHTEYTRRLQWEKAVKERDHLRKQIEKLADYILSISPSGIPEGSAVDVAIKYIKEAAHWVRKLEEKNIELWATKMKAERTLKMLNERCTHWRESYERVSGERDELYVSWKADKSSLELTHSINKKLHKRRLELRQERDDAIYQMEVYQKEVSAQIDNNVVTEREKEEAIRESNQTLDLANDMVDERNKALKERDELVSALRKSLAYLRRDCPNMARGVIQDILAEADEL